MFKKLLVAYIISLVTASDARTGIVEIDIERTPKTYMRNEHDRIIKKSI